jgi:hypothetical protein
MHRAPERSTTRGRPARRSGAAVTALAALSASAAILLAACGSHSSDAQTSPATVSASTATSVVATTSPPATVAGQLPTVPDCGGGAYKPATLLIVCGIDTEMATGVQWSSWTTGGAQGQGTVHLTVNGQPVQAPARLALSDVTTGAVGPQYSVLEIEWIGSSPLGSPTQRVSLAVEPGSGSK